MREAFLIFNAGSSSLKFALYESRSLDLLCRGVLEERSEGMKLDIAGPLAGPFLEAPRPAETGHAGYIEWFLNLVRHRLGDLSLGAAGHRVVHGGAQFAAPIIVDDMAMAALEALVPLAPGHQPNNLMAIRAVARFWPDLPQIACFDTAFHRTQPRLAQLFGLPRGFSDAGILRYGFHGLSYEYIASRLPEIAGSRADGRVIVAHLGHGASLCAMRERRSVATTMGFTSLDGLMMGTRCGAIDPGVLLYLIRERGMSVETVADLLNNRSGLLGVSGISDDVRTLAASDDPRANEALDLFAYRIVREVGSLVSALGGLDLLIFTAGIGEHSALVRRKVCEQLRFFGLELDEQLNASGAMTISSDASEIGVYIVPTNEELPIADAVRRLIGISERPGPGITSQHG
ncbi:acetate kinase [Sphingomonas oleivorans]|uniref:Acetate kinase n=2 Tax=Sphingomonas oleivorans TaxID=1735121 RepID=A0A2T5FZ25_9SPHN|nr:acetate/propionate family kinase [Sphingomonas oleivorans]PTQ11857.1 acetate kinase [Sphingomonas oleivorans]